MNSQQLCATAAITYRQLDHWVRLGYLRPEQRSARGKLGTGAGYERDFPPAEVQVARTMGRLVAAGITPATAARVARGEPVIAPGVRVVLDSSGAVA